MYYTRDSISKVAPSDQENIEAVTNVGRASSCPLMARLIAQAIVAFKHRI